MVPATADRNHERAQETKRRIKEAVFSIARSEGIHAATANRIAEVAGVSKGGLFHHFAQIEDLYLAILEDFIATLDANMDPGSYRTFRSFMNASTAQVLSLFESSPEILEVVLFFVSQSSHNDEYQKRLKRMTEASFESWARRIGRFFEPPLKPGERDSIVRLLDIYFAGVSMHLLMLRDVGRYRRLSTEFTELLLLFIEKRRRGGGG